MHLFHKEAWDPAVQRKERLKILEHQDDASSKDREPGLYALIVTFDRLMFESQTNGLKIAKSLESLFYIARDF